MDIIQKISYWAKHRTEDIAIRCGNEEMSYGELNKKSTYIAQKIVAVYKNKLKQIPVLILCKRNIEFILAIIGTMKSGNYWIPLELPYPSQRIKDITDQFEDYIILTDSIEEWKNLEPLAVISTTVAEDITESEHILKKQEGDNICYMIFTSGTTGVPKGVLIRYESLMNLVKNFLNDIYNYFDEFVCVGVISSFSFDASIKQIFGSIYYGHLLAIARKSEKMFSKKLQHFMFQNHVAVIDGTPSIYRIMMLQSLYVPCPVKIFLIGGELLTWSFVNSFYSYLNYKPIIINVYGPTECCVDASSYWIREPNRYLEGKNVYIGKPIPNAYFHIHGNKMCNGKLVGELHISGCLVGEGYFGKYGSEAFYLDEDFQRTYKTGDLVVRHSDGNFEVLGRLDEQIKVYGNRIELNEISTVYASITNTNVSVVYYAKCNKLCAFIEKYDGELSEKEIHDKAKVKLPEYGVPKYIYFFNEQFPLTQNGKVDKSVLLDIFIDLLSSEK